MDPSNPPRPPATEDFTVGWICALYLELAAALEMLDEEYDGEPPGFSQSSTDRNSYSFGRIGNHFVVIACLRAGSVGAVDAAHVAAAMITTFPSIRFGLLVGIGGAIPRLDHRGDTIRLGDVAISQPTGESGGVFQHDLVKALSDGQTESRGSLNKPPAVLLSALELMKAQHIRGPSKVSDHLKLLSPRMLEPDEGPGYVHQGTMNDRLFEANYRHLGGSTCSECESIGEVTREPRNSTNPKFHYGVIASGNTLCKDPQIRDQIKIREPGCICIEMEAAGLMDDFPCLVIRGISDYSDSHKNDIWQPYAAATAAAYAKELLGYVRAQDVVRAAKASEIMNIQDVLNTVKENTDWTKVHLTEQQIKSWLSPPDPSVERNEALDKRHPGTGAWFLHSEELFLWKQTPNAFLWLHGLSGSGKTILSSALTQHLEQEWDNQHKSRAVIYFFFNSKSADKCKLNDMLRSLVYQLYTKEPGRCDAVARLFTDCHHGSYRPSRAMLLGVLRSLIQNFEDVRIVVDGLDHVEPAENLALLINDLAGIHKMELPNLQLLISSNSLVHTIRSSDFSGMSVFISDADILEDIKILFRLQDIDQCKLTKVKTYPRFLRQSLKSFVKGMKGVWRLSAMRVVKIGLRATIEITTEEDGSSGRGKRRQSGKRNNTFL